MKKFLMLGALLDFAIANGVFAFQEFPKKGSCYNMPSGAVSAKTANAEAMIRKICKEVKEFGIDVPMNCPVVFDVAKAIEGFLTRFFTEKDMNMAEFYGYAPFFDGLNRWTQILQMASENSMPHMSEFLNFFSEGTYGKDILRMYIRLKKFGINIPTDWDAGVITKIIIDDNVDELIKKLAEPPAKNTDTMSSWLSLTALCGSVKCFKYLVLNEAPIDESIVPSVVGGGNYEIMSIVQKKIGDFSNAINQNSIKVVKKEAIDWLLANYYIDIQNIFFEACQFDRWDLVKHLVEEHHCNVETKDNKGLTPLHTASGNGHLDIVKYLIEECHCNVEVKDEKGRNPLHFASWDGHLDIVMKYLVEECHANVEAKANDGYTPLHIASASGYLDIVKYLIEECRCKVDVIDEEEVTPLHVASENGHLDIVKYLIEECNCDAEARTDIGDTPLILATQDGHFDIVKYLIEECHCDANTQDGGDNTPLHMASQGGHLDMVKYFVEKCHCNVNITSVEGTPLQLAAENGSLEVVKYLVEECQAVVTNSTLQDTSDEIAEYLRPFVQDTEATEAMDTVDVIKESSDEEQK